MIDRLHDASVDPTNKTVTLSEAHAALLYFGFMYAMSIVLERSDNAPGYLSLFERYLGACEPDPQWDRAIRELRP